jgi:DNA-binding PadR family transcriptional regulator
MSSRSGIVVTELEGLILLAVRKLDRGPHIARMIEVIGEVQHAASYNRSSIYAVIHRLEEDRLLRITPRQNGNLATIHLTKSGRVLAATYRTRLKRGLELALGA